MEHGRSLFDPLSILELLTQQPVYLAIIFYNSLSGNLSTLKCDFFVFIQIVNPPWIDTS